MKWWQRWTGGLLDLAKRILDDSQPVDRLHAFMQTSFKQIERDGGPGAHPEAGYAYFLAAKLGLVQPGPEMQPPEPQIPSPSEFNRWRENLNEGRVAGPQGLAPGTGLMLLSLLENPRHEAGFLESELERLLRRVEVKRQKALDSAEEHDRQAAWLERHAVAILFSRVARHTQDLRFLNAALKLNDWAYPAHRGLRSGPGLSRYLWSLAEQETSWKELLE